MNIKEVEARTGLSRANIRFYEKENLLHPARLENGYRDYGQKDLVELEKIRLLRALQVSLEEIRQVQTGARSLTQVLAENGRSLESSIARQRQVQEICTRLCAEQTTYGTLCAAPYLQALDGDAPPESDAVQPLWEPWQRYLARTTDFSFWAVLLLWVEVTLARMPVLDSNLIAVGNALVGGLLVLATEPLLLHWWGTTPGKAIFGLRVTNWDGTKLSYAAALERTGNMLHAGCGWNIPLLSTFRQVTAYVHCRDRVPQVWEDDNVQTLQDGKAIRWVAWALVQALLCAGALGAILYTQYPHHWGELTPREFAANYNYLGSQLPRGGFTGANGWYYDLDETGAVIYNAYQTDLKNLEIAYDCHADGTIRKVVMTVQYQGDPGRNTAVPSHLKARQVALRSFVQGQINPFSRENRFAVIWQQLLDHPWESWQLTTNGVLVTQEMDVGNVDPRLLWEEQDYLSAADHSPVFYGFTFTMEKIAD